MSSGESLLRGKGRHSGSPLDFSHPRDFLPHWTSISIPRCIPQSLRPSPIADAGSAVSGIKGRFRQGHLNVFFLNHSILLLGPNPCCKLCTFYVVFASHIFRTSPFILQDLTVTIDIYSGNAYTILKNPINEKLVLANLASHL